MSQLRAKEKKVRAVTDPATSARNLADTSLSLVTRLEAGEWLIANGYENELGNLRHELPAIDTHDKSENTARTYRLHAFAQAHAGDLISAEQFVDKGLAIYPEALDLIYLQAFIAVSFHEHQRALRTIEHFRDIFKKGVVSTTQIPNAYLSAAHLSQIANMSGVSHRAVGSTQQAEEEFRVAIELDSTQHLSWLNLLHLLHSLNRDSEIPDLVKGAQKACPGITEFAQFINADSNGLTVSVCMIVKNEEELLPDALASVQGFATEIIIVDTGSTDRTKEIARAAGAKVIDEPWEGNFSKHRNTSLAHANSEWIFILDADERLEESDKAKLRQIMSQTDHAVVSINVFNLYGKKRESHNFLPSVRLFRRSLGLRYEGIVHNVLKVPPTESVQRTDTRLWHLGYDLSPEKMKKKFERSKALLEAQLKENPENAFAHFNYAQLLRGAEIELQKERSAEIIHSASEAVRLTQDRLPDLRHIHLMALNQLAWAHFVQGDGCRAHEYIDRVLALKSNYLDPLMLRGHLYSKAEQFEKAITAYEEFLKAQKGYRPEQEADDIIVANVSNRAAAYYGIALAYHALGKVQDAKRFYLETLRENDEYHEANQFLGLLELEEGNDGDAIRFLEAQQRTEQPTVHAAVALANIERDRKALSRALQYAMQAVEIDSKNESAFMLLTELLVQSGRSLELPALFEQGMRNGIAERSMRVAEARGWYHQGEFQRVAEILTEFTPLQLSPSDLAKLGDARFRIGAFDGASESYQQALTAGHVDDQIQRSLGVSLLKAGKLHQAATTLRAYLQQDASDQSMWEIVGDIYQRLGEHALAIEAFEKLLQTQTRNKAALLGLCAAYEAMGHLSSARKGYELLARQYPGDILIAARLSAITERCAESEQVH